MTKLFMGCVFATSLVGCSSMNYENSIKPPIIPENQAINTFKMPEQGVVTDQDIHNIPENSNLNYQYKVDF
ncbi:signal peptide protein [Acinetobacter sp. COS3]|uniref:hypothetical protein n=1 Tax=Acinetobacter sp. COS3 TaxID=1397525 RepID=UPI0003B7ED0F|nr:hypothetical protein [Acinetobacter sp. COS3]ERS01377.1 signal peptide protein [Acinetobacter sp. COS3]